MAGRKRKDPGLPEKITKYFHPLKDPDASGTVADMEPGEDPTPLPEKEGLSSVNLDGHNSNNLSQGQAECHNESESSGISVNDLGHIIKPSMTNKEICDAVGKMDSGQKYQLLTEHFKPDVTFNFPRTLTMDVTDHFNIDGLHVPSSTYT